MEFCIIKTDGNFTNGGRTLPFHLPASPPSKVMQWSYNFCGRTWPHHQLFLLAAYSLLWHPVASFLVAFCTCLLQDFISHFLSFVFDIFTTCWLQGKIAMFFELEKQNTNLACISLRALMQLWQSAHSLLSASIRNVEVGNMIRKQLI